MKINEANSKDFAVLAKPYDLIPFVLRRQPDCKHTQSSSHELNVMFLYVPTDYFIQSLVISYLL